MSITKKFFGALADGTRAEVYTLSNACGMEVSILDFGGTITGIRVPDKDGRFSNVTLSFDSLQDYVDSTAYVGALIGRCANRIGKGRFELEGKTYDLYINNNDNHLHGGKVGFSHKVWTVVEADDSDEPSLVLNYISEDGEENYPGRLDVTVTYTLGADNALSIVYRATTDKTTVVNMTNHAYFNLGGCASGKILDHILTVDAESFLGATEDLIPTGEIIPVDGTPLDFRTPKAIGRDIDSDYEPMKLAGGYDHCFNFTDWKNNDPDEIPLRATVVDPDSGRRMDVYTNQPCVQLYSANFLKDPSPLLANGQPQVAQSALCLETQKMPDAINHKGFTEWVLRAGEEYNHVTVYKFSVEK